MGFFDQGGGLDSFNSLLGGLGGLYGGFQGASTANNINSQVQPMLNQNAGATRGMIDSLQQQIAQNRQQAQDMYQRSLGDVTAQNQGIQGNIDTMTSNLNALSDPNSPYMRQAREAIERKDAAAGRNSQWGERETQLAGTLADYVGRYAPGLQSSITGARNQISQNNQGLASLYSTANNPADRNSMAAIQALQQQLQNANAMNTTGRQAANSGTNNTLGLINSGIKTLGALPGLAGLFGGGGGTGGLMDFYGGLGSLSNGITGFGSGIGDTYGSSGMSDMFPSTSYGNGVGSIYDNQQYGYGALPAGDYFGGGGFGGTPMGGFDLSSNDLW